MQAYLNRGELLYSHERYDAAEAEFRKALAEAPEDPEALSWLALAISQQDRPDEALTTAQEAVGRGPDLPGTHYALAHIHLRREEYLKAKAAIEEALRLERDDPQIWATLASIHIARQEYAEALQAANSGLETDPEDDHCQNIKALALTQLGRKDEAAATIQGQLQRTPENAFTHANQGWALLHRGQPKQAAEHFREALRLDPELEFAQQGMLQAVRARNPVFRVLLAYFLWMSRLSSGARWGVLIGGYVVYRIVLSVGREVPNAFVWTLPIIVLYLLFVYLSWAGPALSNLLLRLNRFGRYLLSPDDILASNFVGGSLALAIVFGALALALQSLPCVIAGGVFLALVIPLAGTFSTAPGAGRRGLAIYTGVLAVLGIGAAGLEFAGVPGAMSLALFFVLGFVAFPWIANFMHLRKPA